MWGRCMVPSPPNPPCLAAVKGTSSLPIASGSPVIASSSPVIGGKVRGLGGGLGVSTKPSLLPHVVVRHLPIIAPTVMESLVAVITPTVMGRSVVVPAGRRGISRISVGRKATVGYFFKVSLGAHDGGVPKK